MIKIWGFGGRNTASPSTKNERIKNKTQWYAVSLVPCERACAAVKNQAKTRWLSSEAPRFPVMGCDMATCSCRYQHYGDRRTTARRGVDRHALPRQYEGEERRLPRHERRQSADL